MKPKKDFSVVVIEWFFFLLYLVIILFALVRIGIDIGAIQE